MFKVLQVRRGNPSPDGNGNFSLLDSVPVINDSGQVAFIAGLSGTFGGNLDSTGMFRGDGTPGGLTQIMRQGDALVGGSTLPNLRGGGFGDFSFNEMNLVAFNVIGVGIFETSGGGSITVIARFLQPIPGGTGTFALLLAPALNDIAQVAFTDGLNGIFRDGCASMARNNSTKAVVTCASHQLQK